MNRYILTGASGHIGNNLVRYINASDPGAEVVALTRRIVGRELENTACKQVTGDINDIDFLRENIKEGDRVIHLACLIDLTDKKIEESYRVNFLSAKNICDVSLEKKAGKFIYVGSVDGIYREKDAGIISEPADYYPEKIEGNYGKNKAAAMKYILGKIKENPAFNAAVVLPSAVIGINDYKPSAVGKVIIDTLSKKPEFGIPGGYNFVNVTDVCKAIFTLSDTFLRGQYILSGESVSVEELYGKINRIKGFSKRPIMIPTFLATLCIPFVKVLNKITLKALSEPHEYSFERAKSDFGYSPTPIDEVFEEIVKWYENNYDLKRGKLK